MNRPLKRGVSASKEIDLTQLVNLREVYFLWSKIITTSVANAIIKTIVSNTDIGNTPFCYSVSHDTTTDRNAPTPLKKNTTIAYDNYTINVFTFKTLRIFALWFILT